MNETNDSPSRADERALTQKLRRGEPGAVETVRQRVQQILRYRGFGMQRQDREDLEQEIMTQVWQGVNRGQFRADEGFWGFVSVVASRRAIDWLRKQKPTLSLDDVAANSLGSRPDGPLAAALSGEEARLAVSALKGLGRPCRELVFLRIGLVKSYRQIATMTGRSEGALRTQFCRCVESARRFIETAAEDEGSRRKDVKNDGRT